MMASSALRRHASILPGGQSVVIGALHPAYRYARTLFPSRVFDADEVQRVLKDGHQSRKIGKTVMKGRLAGCPIFTLTLEERATCPRSCTEWASCYGNNMQAAERITPGRELIESLERELLALQAAHPKGFLVRLHVLGDFYDLDYVAFWNRMLDRLPALHVFGFTAHAPSSPIGRRIAGVALAQGWSRWAVRFSGAPHALRASRVLGPGDTDATAIPCPAQTGATDCCATCALCWQTDRAITFRRH